jgi:hypothetical protein
LLRLFEGLSSDDEELWDPDMILTVGGWWAPKTNNGLGSPNNIEQNQI